MTMQEHIKPASQMTSLAGRVALVTGGGSGIGRAGALAMARCGAHVVVTDLEGDSAARTAKAITGEGFKASSAELDVTDDNTLQSRVADIIQSNGRLDIVHSHAGAQFEGTLEQVSPDSMDASWNLNVRAHFMVARSVVPQMRKQGGGSVVITSSNSGVQFDREMIAYATTKHAVVAMTRQMAADYASQNIRFNALCPGWVDTPFNAGFEAQMGGRQALENYIANSIPMGRWATPQEISDAIVFLASDMSSFITGHALVIDGGECI